MALQTPPARVRPVTGTHVVRVQHEGIVTADAERSKDFYCRVLGFQVLPRPAFKSRRLLARHRRASFRRSTSSSPS